MNNNPEQEKWSLSRKVYAHVYIDDAALGCPLVEFAKRLNRRPYVDWFKVEKLLERQGILPKVVSE